MIHTTSIRIIASFAALAFGACGGEEAAPADSISTSGDEDPSASSTNPSNTTITETSADTTQGETTEGETTDDPATTDPQPTTGGPECLGEDDCWQCEPTNNTQVINGCTDATCEGFPNARRLPLLEPDGTLPPLP